jgi:hypothetical protein
MDDLNDMVILPSNWRIGNQGYLDCGALPPLLFFCRRQKQKLGNSPALQKVRLHLDCGALPPLLFFLIVTRNKSYGKAQQSKK